jgi:SOS-response transcriptional repressor LexA
MAGKALLKRGEQRRKAILRFVRSYWKKEGHSPTIQEIADAVGLSSPNATRNHLFTLQTAGFITMKPKVARAITPVDPAPDGWTAQKTAKAS